MLPDEEETREHRQALWVDVEGPRPFGERRHPQLLQKNVLQGRRLEVRGHQGVVEMVQCSRKLFLFGGPFKPILVHFFDDAGQGGHVLLRQRDAQVVANEIVLRVQHGGSEEVEDVGGQI
uniref:Uncharacterized protein n=1 Tax=Micrurus lemniscatus lemniscatus TaxID=129467 RepID=A0A2D4I155_MICLE